MPLRPLALAAFSLFLHGHLHGVLVRLEADGRLTRDGKPYFVKGAGGSEALEELARRGGNSIRTWTTGDLGPLLDQAAKLNLTISAGIWLEPECSWFSYANPEHCEKQAKRVRAEVLAHKDHPALLMWGLGNEFDGDGKNVPLWKQLNKLAQMVRAIDPDHPTFTAVAGLSRERSEALKAHCPDLGLIGINTYGALPHLRKHLKELEWTRPWMLTEYGPRGFWEVEKTSWGTPVEATSSQKADFIRMAYPLAIKPDGGCLGSYAFLWGNKQEASTTWFGLLLEDGATTEAVDVLQELWSGQKPSNYAPRLKELNSKAAKAKVKAEELFTAKVTASDPDGDPLTYGWSVTLVSAGHDSQGREKPTPPLPGCITLNGNAEVQVKAPKQPGDYRLHVRINDNHKQAATANFPFRVEP